MEAAGGEEVLSSCKDQSQIVKGKRTKRQRPTSPIPFVVTTMSTTNNNLSSPASSTDNYYMDHSTEEDEDMANCLILLAQCQDVSPKQDDRNNKFNSRKFLEAPASTGTGKAGYYVYECKTCNRTFPSFQALGGHRASHKKPKAGMNSSDEEEVNFKNVSSLSLQLSNTSSSRAHNLLLGNKGKVHECSICGAEFNSGQALGGHMRRHRAPPVVVGNGTTTSTTTALSLTPMVMAAATLESDHDPRNIIKPRNVISLDLDLNLPAPEDDHQMKESSFTSKQQQKSPLVFSAPTLVDCHY